MSAMNFPTRIDVACFVLTWGNCFLNFSQKELVYVLLLIPLLCEKGLGFQLCHFADVTPNSTIFCLIGNNCVETNIQPNVDDTEL